MKIRKHKPSGRIIILGIASLMFGGFVLLASELSELQVKQQDGFKKMLRNQSVRRVRLPSVRGKIFDSKGRCLADSIPNYCIAIYTHELRSPRSSLANTLELIHEIWSKIGSPPNIDYKSIKQHLILTPELPLEIYKNLTDNQVSRWREQFEIWTAPPRNSFRRKKIAGLQLGYPLEGRSIFIQTSDLLSKRTSTAANTLELIYEISERANLEREVSFQDIKDHIYARRALPLIAWKNLNMNQVSRWADSCSLLSGSDIICLPDRTYTNGKDISHLIGYTLRADSNNTSEDYGRIHYDLRGLSGQKGLEGVYNEILSGKSGYQILQVDAAGFHNRELEYTPPKAGGDIYLTIDAKIQEICNDSLNLKQYGEKQNEIKGAAVVLDVTNGDVLAIVSAPNFDPNMYMKSSKYRQNLMIDSNASTFNRAVFGQYPPGSTFKTITSLAALSVKPEHDKIKYNCQLGYEVSGRNMKCWTFSQGFTLGEINLHDALMHSCNIYMYEMAQDIGYDPIVNMAKSFGLGQYAGLFPELNEPDKINDAKYGNLPEKSKNVLDLCNMSIGQGELLTSPLQMAMVTAAIANDGTLYRPRLIKSFRKNDKEKYQNFPVRIFNDIQVSKEALSVVQKAMHDVIMDENGSGYNAKIKGVKIAGKTGSAQYRKKTSNKITDHVYAWMISYAPYDSPKYAIAMVVEDGVSGGKTIAPRLAYLYKKLFEYDGTINGASE